ncbi:hypothetical protein, partial [Bilophila wadsworthia]|uniref:hypothetical protein n=1 Tax=Bilophila wadsworthia TaxID=35833 RepID=UPI0026DB3874
GPGWTGQAQETHKETRCGGKKPLHLLPPTSLRCMKGAEPDADGVCAIPSVAVGIEETLLDFINI